MPASTPEPVAPAVGQASTAPRILAIDPGPKESGWCLYQSGSVLNSGVLPNDLIRADLALGRYEVAAIEMIASYGMAVGAEVFATCVEIGRMIECARRPEDVRLVYRRDVKLHLCGTVRAKDPNVRAALLDLLGPQGNKRDPGPLYGVKSHAWSAVAVAVTAAAQP